jgi:hypothetical protein
VQVRRWNEAKPKDAPQDRQPNSAGLVPIDEDDDDDDEWWEANDDEDDDVAYSPAVPPPTPRSGPVPDLCAPPLFPMTEMTAAPVASNSWSEWDGDDYGDSSSDTDLTLPLILTRRIAIAKMCPPESLHQRKCSEVGKWRRS